MLGSKVSEVKEKKNGQLSVKIESSSKTEVLDYEKILVAVGRKPNTQSLNLAAANVVVNEQGFVNNLFI